MSKIEKSTEGIVDRGLIALVEEDQPLVVSGMPLRVFHPTNPQEDKFFTECNTLNEEASYPPFRIFYQHFGSSVYSMPEIFLPTDTEQGYPVIQGYTIDGYEVVLGISRALGFVAKALDR